MNQTPSELDRAVARQVKRQLEAYGIRVDALARSTPFAELRSDADDVSLVNISKPTKERPFHTLFTTSVPRATTRAAESDAAAGRTELMLCLPLDWPLALNDIGSELNNWPIRLLSDLSELPEKRGRSLSVEEAVPHGDPPAGYSQGTALCYALLTRPQTLPEAATVFDTSAGPVNLLAVVPIYEAEFDLAHERGAAALMERLNAFAISEVVSPERAPVVPRRVFGSTRNVVGDPGSGSADALGQRR